MRKEFNTICKAVNGAGRILIATHTDPDGDAIGSMIALYILFKSLKRKVTMYCREKVPSIYSFLHHSKEIKNEPPKNTDFDVAIAVDCGDIKRLGRNINIRSHAKTLINIDHHPDNTKFGDVNYVRDISSVSEMIYELFGVFGIKINKEAATCLYTGIMTDTGNFRYDYTTPQTLRIAASLAENGANISRIAMTVYEAKTIPSLKILGAAMYRLESSDSGKVVWTVLNKDLIKAVGAKSEDLTGIVDQLRSIKGAEVAILFREEADEIKVNFRSKFNINVSAIAKKLGGGGHVKASGAIMHGNIEDVKNKVLSEVFKVIK